MRNSPNKSIDPAKVIREKLEKAHELMLQSEEHKEYYPKYENLLKLSWAFKKHLQSHVEKQSDDKERKAIIENLISEMQPFFEKLKQFYDKVEDNAIGHYLRCLDEYFNYFDRDSLVSLNHPEHRIEYLMRSRQDDIHDIRLYICLSPKMEYDTLPYNLLHLENPQYLTLLLYGYLNQVAQDTFLPNDIKALLLLYMNIPHPALFANIASTDLKIALANRQSVVIYPARKQLKFFIRQQIKLYSEKRDRSTYLSDERKEAKEILAILHKLDEKINSYHCQPDRISYYFDKLKKTAPELHHQLVSQKSIPFLDNWLVNSACRALAQFVEKNYYLYKYKKEDTSLSKEEREKIEKTILPLLKDIRNNLANNYWESQLLQQQFAKLKAADLELYEKIAAQKSFPFACNYSPLYRSTSKLSRALHVFYKNHQTHSGSTGYLFSHWNKSSKFTSWKALRKEITDLANGKNAQWRFSWAKKFGKSSTGKTTLETLQKMGLEKAKGEITEQDVEKVIFNPQPQM